jgi:hypothetical protein
MSTQTVTYWPTGGLWEGSGFEVRLNEAMSRTDAPGSGFVPPCPHAIDVRREPGRWTTTEGPFDAELVSWRVPRVICSYNQAGHDSTGVCADCVVDAVRALPDA